MLGVLNQSYKNITHAVNITLDNDSETTDYTPLYEDLLGTKIFVVTYNKNHGTHINNMTAIKSVSNYHDYDLFIKMDSDDIYKKDYVTNIVHWFQGHNYWFGQDQFDIVSSKINVQLNGFDLYKGPYDNLGGNTDNTTYRMPMTFAFTRKALDVILETEEIPRRHDDYIWRQAWDKAGLVHYEVSNGDEIIWHIHGKNLSTAKFLRKPNQYQSIVSY